MRALYAWGTVAGERLRPATAMKLLPEGEATIFVLAYVVAHLYAVSRATCGAGAKTALCVGLMVGFAAGFPGNMASATWSPMSRMLPLWWMLELWIGAVLASLVAGYLYKD